MDMTATEFRHAHLLDAIQKHGSIENLARATEMNPQYISQLNTGARGIGHKTARKFEKALGLPDGAWDRPPDGDLMDGTLVYLMKTLPENDTVNAIAETLPQLSDSSVKRIAAVLVGRLSADTAPQE